MDPSRGPWTDRSADQLTDRRELELGDRFGTDPMLPVLTETPDLTSVLERLAALMAAS